MGEDRSGHETPEWKKYGPSGLLNANAEVVKKVGDHLLRDAPKRTRFILKRIPEGPGLLYDLTQAFTSDEPLKDFAEIAGGAVGGSAGGALGAAAGGVNAPIGAVLGSAAGTDIADDIYDDYYRNHRAKIDATNKWIVDRRKELFGR